MIRPIVCFCLTAALFWSGPACKSDSNSNSAMSGDSTALSDTVGPQKALEVPPVSAVVESEVEKQIAKSPFKNIGCCVDETRRKTEDCCCQDLLEMYKKMLAGKDKNIAKVKMEDPILAVCRKKLKREFEEVDNPPPPPGKENSTDDLY